MAIVKKYRAEVVSVINSIEGVYTVEFRSLDKPFKYEPGQFLHLALDQNYDGIGQWPESRCFSMQSSPQDEFIKITYAVKGSFTKNMEACLKPGVVMHLKMPYGDLFTRQHSKANCVFIAGGTGITPFLSLFTHSSFSLYDKPVLYAGFRNEKTNLYEKGLISSKKINHGFIWFISYEETAGRLNVEDIFTQHATYSTFFLSGPPPMIKSFKNYLIIKGVNQNQVLTDDWG